ncbi:MAG: hypothetical protein LQ351_002925 [Letrouitia transgressa]|nr:MAG: hypothetical protein LQ351_002925 [Letrouitia transgressa]
MNKDQVYQQGAEAQYPEDQRNESKKKHTRAKRSRYISIACEFRAMNTTIQNLQAQVESLYANLSAFHNSPDGHPSPYQGQSTYSSNTTHPDPHPDEQHSLGSSTPVRRRHRCFQGPTSSGFSFNVAKSSLQTMGITNPSLNSGEGQDCDDPLSKPTQQEQLSFASVASPTAKDPIWDIGRDEGIRLCNVYEEEIGMMYPMLDMEKLVAKAEKFFTSTKSRRTTGQISTSESGADCMRSTDVNILKMILATVLMLEGGGQSETGKSLFESVRDTCESRLWEPVDTEGLILLVIIAQYRFQQGEEVQAYRIIGLAARMCFEMGLHRKEVLSRESQRADSYWLAPRLFWSIFVLDRRWSFGTGLPFAIQDADIDPHLPEPDASTPYLTAMIAYSRIASKVWRSITAPEGAGSEIKKDTMSYLDYEILQWQNSVPESLRFYPTADISDRGSPNRAQRRLQVILYLRMNQMRILIYRPVLHSVTSIMENRRYAQIVVEVAKDTVRVLTRLNNTTDIYRTQQVCFNHFLVSALAALFLAVSHAPVEFNQVVRDEFYMALDLVSGFSAQTYVSQRLWKTIKGLKEVGPRLGLVSRQPMTDFVDPHSSAAVAMAGLAGHRVDEMTAFPVATSATALSRSPISGQQMSYELTNLFEAAGGAGSFGSTLLPTTSQGGDGAAGYVSAPGEETRPAASQARGNTTSEREYSKIMQDLF